MNISDLKNNTYFRMGMTALLSFAVTIFLIQYGGIGISSQTQPDSSTAATASTPEQTVEAEVTTSHGDELEITVVGESNNN